LGNEPNYVICVNTIPLILAKRRTGELPSVVIWRDVSSEFPTFLQLYFDQHKAEGVGWKFAPLRLSAGCLELALDNDCILWELPKAVWKWLQTPGSFLFAEDVKACFGQFSEICGLAPRNSGIRELPPGFDLEEAMIEVLRKHRFTLSSELDEQGAADRGNAVSQSFVVDTQDVSICSPLRPHISNLGRCGAHFVGLNAKSLPWNYDGRARVEYIREHWTAHLPEIRKKIAIC
jgi:hypothetical protein